MAKTTPLGVALYIPNLIGYLRVVFVSISMYYSFDAPATAMVYYFLGQGMDAIDGVAARALGQVSSFGAMLDMLTDRMGTAVLSVVLSHLYPSMWGFFTFLIVLDTVSHWFQMYATATSGKKTHKGSANPLLNFYYTFPYALLVFCCLNELFFICAYLMAHYSHPLLNAAAAVSFPVFVAKQFMNVVQLYECCRELTTRDAHAANGTVPEPEPVAAPAPTKRTPAPATAAAAAAPTPAHAAVIRSTDDHDDGHDDDHDDHHGHSHAGGACGHAHHVQGLGSYDPNNREDSLRAFTQRFR